MSSRRSWCLAAMALLVTAPTAAAQTYRTVVESRQLNGESRLAVDVGFAVGSFSLAPAAGSELYRLALVYDEELFRPDVRYRESRNRLNAELESLRRNTGRDLDDLDQRMDLTVSPLVSLDLEVGLGAADADVELGGLSLRTAHIKTGASQTVIRFSEPNRAICERLRFEVGAAEFEALHLAHARCREIELSGGVAEMTLDFTGAWAADVQTAVLVEMGLGQLRLRLPETLGVRLHVHRFLVGLDRSGFDRVSGGHGTTYVSGNWDQAEHHVVIAIDAALGSVEVDWLRP